MNPTTAAAPRGARTVEHLRTETARPLAPARTHGIQVIHPSRIDRERYEELLALPTDALRARAAEEIRRELALDDDAQREAVHQRLAAWLDLDHEAARIIARVWDEAASQLPPEDARRRFEAERDALLHGFRFDEFTRFADLAPWVTSRLGLEVFGAAATAA